MLNQPQMLGQQAGLNTVQPTLYPPLVYASIPVPPEKVPTEVYTRSLALTETGTLDVLRQCNTFKLETIRHAKYRKLNQERNYAYFNNQFFGDDLLPLPSSEGDDRSVNTYRPQVFIPVVAEQLLQIYAFLRIRMFPNDEDFFRVVAKKEEYAVYEDDLTEALKYIFKKNKISDQIGRCLINALWSGQFVAYPTFELVKGWKWLAPTDENPDYQLVPSESEPRLIVQEVNPIHLYLDPITSTNPRWMILAFKKQQEILDSPFTIEQVKERVRQTGGSGQPLTSQYQEGLPIAIYNQVNNSFTDYEKWLMHDTFYFPYIKADGKMFYNVSVVMVENSIITEFRPNVAFPDSQLVQTPCRYQTESNYGYGPADDMQNLQIIINMLYNYLLESISRNGNVWGVMDGVDLKQLFGSVARILITPAGIPPNEAIMPIAASHEELVVIQNIIGVLKGEAVNIGGSQDPFQGASNIDFKKTATEIQVLQSNAVSRVQELVEHLAPHVGEVLEKLAFFAAKLYQGPITVRIDNPKASPPIPGQQPGPQDMQAAQAQQAAAQGIPVPTPQGPFFRQVDLSALDSGEFVIEMTGVNSSQSKAAEAQLLMQLIQMIASNPQGALLAEGPMHKLATLNGLKEFSEMFDTFKQRFAAMQMQEQMQAQQAAMQMAQQKQQEGMSEGQNGTP